LQRNKTIREELEDIEKKTLSPLGTKSRDTKGRVFPEEKCPIRTEFQRDRDRIIHSKAFRRLKEKTQVFFFPAGDHYRTRLTHVLEVSQISRVIGKSLRLNEDLIEAIALGHDLGHAPFGHMGEEILDKKYKEYVPAGGFKHNEQSLRIVDVLEEGYRNKERSGLNLTWEVRDGILKHSKGLREIKEGIIKDMPKTPEGLVVALSDRIAYLNHDLDDAIRAGVVKESDIPRSITKLLGNATPERIDTMVKDLINNFIQKENLFFSEEISYVMDIFLEFLKDVLYYNDEIRGEERFKIEKVISDMFDYFMEKPEKLLSFVNKYELPQQFSTWEDALKIREIRTRYVCDYISGMTDEYLLSLYNDLFIPKPWTK